MKIFFFIFFAIIIFGCSTTKKQNQQTSEEVNILGCTNEEKEKEYVSLKKKELNKINYIFNRQGRVPARTKDDERNYDPTKEGFYITSCLEAATIGKHSSDKNKKLLNCVKLGVLKSDQGKKQESLYYHMIACGGGNMAGCYWLGLHYKIAEGYLQGDFRKAKALYTTSCYGGYEKACNALGMLFEQQGDIKNARNVYKNTCDRGNLGGCHDLGGLESSQGNSQKAKQILGESCKKGFKISCDWMKKI